MSLNCKPGQRAMIVRGCRTHDCIGQRVGVPVVVDQVVVPSTLAQMLLEIVDGPSWRLQSAVSCPDGVEGCGIEVIPDKCLRPFDDLEPESDDTDTGASRPARTETPGTVEVLTEGGAG